MSPQAGWILVNEIVPRLRCAILQSVQRIGCEDAEELVQDATCMAARILHGAEAKGKAVPSSSVAYYAIQHARCGRRTTGNSCLDALATGTQFRGHSRVESLEMVVASAEESGGEIFLLHDVLSRDEEDPSTRAARKLDWEEFYAGLPERERVAVDFLIEGKTVTEAGRSLGWSPSTMVQSRRSLAAKILEFMGSGILREVQRRPAWKEGLEANRERLACRHERMAA